MFAKQNRLPLITGLVKLLLTAVFALAALGKLWDVEAAALVIQQLLGVPEAWSGSLVWGVSLTELAVAGLIWWRVPKVLLAVPLVLAGIFLYSNGQGLDCGCFGTLPVLGQLSSGGHLLLLGGMFLGFFLLTQTRSNQPAVAVAGGNRRLFTLGVVANALVVTAFLSLLFPTAQDVALAADIEVVDRFVVEAALTEESALLVDARFPFQYRKGRLPGAINVPFDTEDLETLMQPYDLEAPMIVYCSNPECNAASVLATALSDLGFEHLRVYDGGWDEWLAFCGVVEMDS